MKFAHIGDCHLGGWRQPELQNLSIASFNYAVTKCIKTAVDFVLITGDLFDSAYPPIETLRDTFREFSRLNEAKIPVFIIAGSHDYSASGKTFLEVLSHSGFCTNAAKFEEHKGKIMLTPTIFRNIAIYGYPGKKSGLEVDDINRITLQDSPGMFKILMLHTTLRDAVGTLPIPAVDEKLLPKVDYIALSHLHIHYHRENRVYSGPLFPNNIQELEELQAGSFIIFDNGNVKREIVKIKDIFQFSHVITNALSATEEIISVLDLQNIKDKIVILNLSGTLEQGNIADIDFQKIEAFSRQKSAYSFIKSTSKVNQKESGMIIDHIDSPNLEEHILEKFLSQHTSKYNNFAQELIRSLQISKIEEERSVIFQERLISELRKTLQL